MQERKEKEGNACLVFDTSHSRCNNPYFLQPHYGDRNLVVWFQQILKQIKNESLQIPKKFRDHYKESAKFHGKYTTGGKKKLGMNFVISFLHQNQLTFHLP